MSKDYKLIVYEADTRRWLWKAMSLNGQTVIAAASKASPSQYQAKRNAAQAGYFE